MGVRELVRFDPDDDAAPLRVWDGADGELIERDHDDPRLWRCDILAAFWCIRVDPALGRVLRLSRDPGGTYLYPTPEERVRELEAELAKRAK